jgi:hypothetical protein
VASGEQGCYLVTWRASVEADSYEDAATKALAELRASEMVEFEVESPLGGLSEVDVFQEAAGEGTGS